jgi:hypothetical protein
MSREARACFSMCRSSVRSTFAYARPRLRLPEGIFCLWSRRVGRRFRRAKLRSRAESGAVGEDARGEARAPLVLRQAAKTGPVEEEPQVRLDRVDAQMRLRGDLAVRRGRREATRAITARCSENGGEPAEAGSPGCSEVAARPGQDRLRSRARAASSGAIAGAVAGTSSSHRGASWSPVVVLGVEAGDHRVAAGDVRHRQHPRSLQEIKS